MSRTPLKIAAALVAAFVVLPALAGEGRIPVYQYPTIIGAPGKYIVTRDISGAGGLPVINIQAQNVDLDINGFTLREGGAGAPVIAITGDLVDVIIRNGILEGGTQSIERGSGAAQIGDRVVIEDVQTKSAGNASIHLWGIREVVIRRVNIIEPGGHGIWLERPGASGFTNGMIEHCAIRMDGGLDGIHADYLSSFAIRHNRIETPSLHGIHTLGSFAPLIGENTISDADGNGIFFEATMGGKIYNNVISRGETNGVMIDPGSAQNLILDNLVRQSGWAGAPAPGSGGGDGYIVMGFLNKLEGNTAIENDRCGFDFMGPDNTFGNNMARLNDPAGIGWCNSQQAGGPCVALPAPDFCDQLGGAGNDSRGDNMPATGLGPF